MSSSPDRRRAALPVLLARGLVRRCAWCGGKGAFCTSWYGRQERCRTCGLGWERGYEGFELGAATMGVFLTFGSIITWMIVSVVTGVPLAPLLVVAGVIAVAVPIVGYPITYTIWFGVDLFIREPSAEDLEAARAWLASRDS